MDYAVHTDFELETDEMFIFELTGQQPRELDLDTFSLTGEY